MNSSNILLFVLSLVFTIIKGDLNDTNVSISKQRIREFMDDFADSLARLYTEHSRDSLDEIMDFFDDDEQEICIVAECYRKERGNNNARDYLENNLMGKYNTAKITFQMKARASSPSSSSEEGYFVRINSAQYLIDNAKKCESSLAVFLLKTDDDNDLYIIKWIESTDPEMLDCEPITDDDNHYCMPGAFCQVTDEAAQDEIVTQLLTFEDELISELQTKYSIDWHDLNISNISIQSQVLSGGRNIRIILLSKEIIGVVVIEYYVSMNGRADPDSFTLVIDCNGGSDCEATKNGVLAQLWSIRDIFVSDLELKLESYGIDFSELKLNISSMRLQDSNGTGKNVEVVLKDDHHMIGEIVIEYYVSMDGIVDPDSFEADINCIAGSFCEVTDETSKKEILDQLKGTTIKDIFASELEADGLYFSELKLNIKYIKLQELNGRGMNINAVLEDGNHIIDEIVIKYYVSSTGEIDERSVSVHFEMLFPRIPLTTKTEDDITN